MSIVNKPRVSKPIVGVYAAITVFIAALAVFIAYLSLSTPMGTIGTTASVLLLIIFGVFILLLASFYRTRYVLEERKLGKSEPTGDFQTCQT